MSIADEVLRIKNAKQNIKTAIEEKGVAVGDGLIDTYAEKINEISVGGGETDLTELINLQESYIYGGLIDVLHLVGFEQTAEGDYITGYIPCTSEDIVYVKNIDFAEDTPIICQAESEGGFENWFSIGDDWLDFTDNGNIKTLSFTTQDPFVEYIRLRFKSYRFIPIVTINEPLGGESL